MEQNRATKSRRHHNQPFKVDAMRLVTDGGRPILEIAKVLRNNRDQLNRWKRLFGKKGSQAAFPGNGNLNSEKKKLEELRRELARVKEEREIPTKSHDRLLTTALMR